jgi:hypothetical protein
VLVDSYNNKKADLDALRQEANKIREMQGLPMKDRQELLRINIFQQNMLKRRLLDQFKAYDPDLI